MSHRFRRLVAQEVVTARVKGNAQLVGLQLARITPSSGAVAIKQLELAELVGLTENPVRLAVRELVEAGLLTVKRRGSVANVFTWTTLAYTETGGKTPVIAR